MNNSGQIGLINLVFGLIAFFILWVLFLGEWLNEWALKAITDNSLTGIEAFLLNYINLWVFIGLFIGVMAYVYIGGSRQ
jgi:hypothetical protein